MKRVKFILLLCLILVLVGGCGVGGKSITATTDIDKAEYVKLGKKYKVFSPGTGYAMEYSVVKFKAPKAGDYILRIGNAHYTGDEEEDDTYIGSIDIEKWDEEGEDYDSIDMICSGGAVQYVQLLSEDTYEDIDHDFSVTEITDAEIEFTAEANDDICIEVDSYDPGVCDLQIVKK